MRDEYSQCRTMDVHNDAYVSVALEAGAAHTIATELEAWLSARRLGAVAGLPHGREVHARGQRPPGQARRPRVERFRRDPDAKPRRTHGRPDLRCGRVWCGVGKSVPHNAPCARLPASGLRCRAAGQVEHQFLNNPGLRCTRRSFAASSTPNASSTASGGGCRRLLGAGESTARMRRPAGARR